MRRKPLHLLSSADFKEELSIAGNPDKIMDMRQRMLAVMSDIDSANAAELINLEFLMERLLAEARTWMKLYGQRTGQKIYPQPK